MESIPLVSFQVNSYNRLAQLKNLLESFEVCNEHPKVEWVITDFGSKDGSRSYIQEYKKNSSFPVKVVLGDEEQYFNQFRIKGLGIDSRWARFRAVLGKYRREARRQSAGELMCDMSEDHQFIRRGRWIEEVLEIYRHREEMVGKDDIACVVAYGYLRVRLSKQNNSVSQQENEKKVPYFVAREKSYVDYVFMKKTTAERVGQYLDPLSLQPGTPAADRWEERDDYIQPEAEYERRCRALGLKRVFMKYPLAVAFPNNGQSTYVPFWSLKDMKRRFGYLNRPVSSDELCRGGKAGALARGVEHLRRIGRVN